MRLKNKGIFDGHTYRIVLDTHKESANYVERTKGAIFDEKEGNHLCSHCLREIAWIDWKFNDTFATATCDCGKKATIRIFSFVRTATEVI